MPQTLEHPEDILADNIYRAAQCWHNRHHGCQYPQGRQDDRGRWYPVDAECRACCYVVRSPSRRRRWSLYRHCFTMRHVAHLYGVDERLLRAYIKKEGSCPS